MELKNVEIINIGELKTFASGFSLVEFVVKDDMESQYPQEILMQIVKEKAEKFLQYQKVGDRVDIKFNIQGRSYLKEGEPEENRKWFNNLSAWSVFKAEGGNTEQPQPKPNPQQEQGEDLAGLDDDGDGLPF